MPSYFEITISSRQLALAVVGVIALVLVGFGLGVLVGIQEPTAVREVPSGTLAVVPEPTFVPSAGYGPPADVVDALRGEDTGAPASVPAPATQVAPAETVPAATEPPATVPLPTEPPPTAVPTRLPVTPSATEFPLPRLGRGVWVQVGALAAEAGAQNLRRRVMQLGYTPTQVVVQAGSDGKYRVRVGPFPDDESAGRVVARLRADGFPGAFTVRE